MRTTRHVEHELDLVVEQKEPVADEVVRLVLRRPDGTTLPRWEPGAHVDLVLRDDLVRQYSLCGDPHDPSALHVAVLREEPSRGGSRYVHDKLAEGDTVRVRRPRNHFPLVHAKRYLFLAGGIGITPILPMIAQLEATGAHWRLVYGGRTRSSMAFREDLEQRYPDKITLHPQDEVGLLDLPNLLGQPGKTADDLVVYCCGPETLLGAVEQQCASWPTGALHVERFAPKQHSTDGPADSFEVELAQTGTTLTIPADRSILDILEECGVHVLSSCQEGTCGTCETAVLSGLPEHRDVILTSEEQDANDTMMICVSRSHTRHLVLDL